MFDEFGEEINGSEAGVGFGKPFRINLFMIPEENPFAVSADSPPEIIDLPDDFSVLLNELVDKSWTLRVEDDNELESIVVDIGAASSFLTYTITGKVV